MQLQIDSAREQIVALREALLQEGPEAASRNMLVLHSALDRLERLKIDLFAAPPAERAALRTSLESLRDELQRTSQVIDFGKGLWDGWARLLGASNGYTASGEPAPVSSAGHCSVQG